jgi:preprotein translocase subunit SecE
MAKKTSTQGKKAKSESGRKPTEDGQKSSAVEKKSSAVEKKSSAVEKKSSQKTAKPTKDSHKSSKGGKSAPKKENILTKIVSYFKNVRLEIKRTTWPTRDEVLRMSLIVVGALIFFGVFIFIIDWVMTWFVKFFGSLAIGAPDPTTIPDASLAPDVSDTVIPDTTEVPSDGATTGSEATE